MTQPAEADNGSLNILAHDDGEPFYGEAYFEVAEESGARFVQGLIDRGFTPSQVNIVLTSMDSSIRDRLQSARPESTTGIALRENGTELGPGGHFLGEVIAAAQGHLSREYGVGLVSGHNVRDDSQRPVERIVPGRQRASSRYPTARQRLPSISR